MLTPILIVGDSPERSTGLARVLRDIATVLVGSQQFRVATLGLGGQGTSRLPFQQYTMVEMPASPELSLQESLVHAWTDHTRGELGILFTIWDLTRLLWLAQPGLMEESNPTLSSWLMQERKSGRMRLWGYVPVDATGPSGRLTTIVRSALLGYDRLIAYTRFGEDTIRATIGEGAATARGLTWFPHGIDGRVFCPEAAAYKLEEDDDRRATGEAVDKAGRGTDVDINAGLCAGGRPVGDKLSDQLPTLIGIVAANQARKDWGLMACVCAALRKDFPDMRFWWHSDTTIRYWSLPALIADFGLDDVVELTLPPMHDREMARRLRECAITLHLGLGEGWGLPIFESLACGTAALHGAYAGGASMLESCGLGELLVPPSEWRLEGQHNSLRPVFTPEAWTNAVKRVLATSCEDPRGYWSRRVGHLSWRALAKPWRKLMEEGLDGA